YGPAVFGAHLRGVVGHRAEAVRHHVEEVADGRIAETVLVVRGRMAITAANHHAVTLAGAAVARRAEDVESFVAALHHLVVDRKWKDGGVRAVDLAGVEQRVVSQLSARHRACDEGTGRTLIGEK